MLTGVDHKDHPQVQSGLGGTPRLTLSASMGLHFPEYVHQSLPPLFLHAKLLLFIVRGI